MKKTTIVSCSAALALSGCFGPGEPVVLPEDTFDAARTCFVAQGLTMREGKGEDDPVTYPELTESLKYSLAATAQIEPFSVQNAQDIVVDTGTLQSDLRTKDYAGAIATCDQRFELDKEIALPQEDADAVLQCLAFSSFMNGVANAQGADFGKQGERIGALFERLESQMESDPEVLIKLIEGEQVMHNAARAAFAEAAPREFIDACDARFPAE